MPKDHDARLFLSTKADFAVYALILSIGVCKLLLHHRAPDFMGEDVFFADAARNLLQHGYYGVDGVRETTQPPGLSGILAVLFAIFGYSYATALCAMAVFETLGFLAFYEFLRRRAHRILVAGIVILLMSSPLYFGWATRLVFPCFAYFFTTMLALLAEDQYAKTERKYSRLAWGAVLALSVMTSLLIAVSTTALLLAILAVILFTARMDRRQARTQLFRLLPVFLIGAITLGWWMFRPPAPLDWSLPGYPDSYLNQLPLKSGNQPELGMARWRDVPIRVFTNAAGEADILAQLVLRHGVKRSRVAAVTIPMLLMVIGWIFSIVVAKGEKFVDWYFAGYQFIYLLWPWTMDTRFLLPIAPLACFYIWQGIHGLIHAAKSKPRLVGSAGLILSLVMILCGLIWIRQHAADNGGLPDLIVLSLWLMVAACAAWTTYKGQPPFLGEFRLRPWRSSLLYAASLVVIGLILFGTAIDAQIARENLHGLASVRAGQTGPSETLPHDVDAGLWLREHTPPDSVVMARHWGTVRHYAERKVIWFAPISDPAVLLEGIRRHAVDYIVVVTHPVPDYLPDEDLCIENLLNADPAAFQLVLDKGDLRIFRVNSEDRPPADKHPTIP